MSDNTEKKEYYFEQLSKDNLGDLDKLHNAVYSKPHNNGYFIKKYDTAYTGVAYMGFFAYNDKHEPMAYYGVIPCFIRYEDQLLLAAQSADTMTHPKYRFKGLFIQLANLTFDLCKQKGISVVFGFPNQNSLHGFLFKLRWRMTETMDCYIIPTGIISLETISKTLPFLKKIYSKYQEKVLQKYLVPQKGIENSVFKDDFAGVNRNAHYVNYKRYHDTQVIRIGQSLLWIKIRNGLVIGDINCREEDFDDMMHHLKKIALKLGLRTIQFHTSHQTKLSSLFGARYSAVPSFHVLFKDLGSHIELDKIKFTFADIDIF
jgi:hypothetical protein